MKLTKRIFALALALCLLLCLSISAFAEETVSEPKSYKDMTQVEITKIYNVANEGTSAPAEDFELVVDHEGYPSKVTDSQLTTANAPQITEISKASFASETTTTDNSSTAKFIVTLPTYEYVGKYTYELYEKEGTTAGTSYHTTHFKLVVTVIEQDGYVRVAAVHTEEEGGQKSNTITNVYSAGELSISKTVAGTLGDKKKYFAFTVKLTGEQGKTYNDGGYAVTGGTSNSNPSYINVDGRETTVYLKDTETLHIANLPYGVQYEITENIDISEGYKTTVGEDETTKAEGTIGTATTSVTFKNEKGGTPDTGISLDSLPYILALAVALGGAVVLFTRKRHIEE